MAPLSGVPGASAHVPPEPSSLTQPSQLSCPCGAANRCETVAAFCDATYTDVPSALTATPDAPSNGLPVPGTSAQTPPEPSSLTQPSQLICPPGAAKRCETVLELDAV